MSVIYKYPLAITDNVDIPMPINSFPLTIHFQYGVLCLWVYVPDPDAVKVVRNFAVVGTGNYFDGENFRYIGSSVDPNAPFVWHVFERTK